MSDESLITTVLDRGVATVTIDAPPINVMSRELFRELRRFCTWVSTQNDVRVVVFRSADPEFFIAHFDVELLLELSASEEPISVGNELSPFQQMCERLCTMPKVTIAEIGGRVGGGGSEFSASCDMRFGAIGRTVVNQMEVALGILPGGSGTQRLPRLIGRGRAMEMILGAQDLDAETAERWGYLNAAVEPDLLRQHVDNLAHSIASHPVDALVRAKRSVLNTEELPLREGLIEEARLFEELLQTDAARAVMTAFLQMGGQTRDGEVELGSLLDRLRSAFDP
ncbi:enoyl-CoA hydratase/isomerase family protein [Pseudonocardia yunnanensis]|uniref:Enoyl-CoA hydratase/isomerase family protein n=1 Tax=Pseudonocardia yunnanensis TaxID=58107 RepID=A0ABW4FBZ2_9PSEU